MNYDIERWRSQVRIEDREYEVPFSVEHFAQGGGILAILLRSVDRDRDVDPPFQEVTEESNVIAFDEDGYKWVIEAAQDERSSPEYVGYRYVWSSFGGLYAVHQNGKLYEINAESGSLVQEWPWNHFPLPEGTAVLDGQIQTVLEDDSGVYVRCRESETDLYAFDGTGRKKWESSDRRGSIFLEDGDLLEQVRHGPRSETWYRLNKATGERLEEVENPHSSKTDE